MADIVKLVSLTIFCPKLNKEVVVHDLSWNAYEGQYQSTVIRARFNCECGAEHKIDVGD